MNAIEQHEQLRKELEEAQRKLDRLTGRVEQVAEQVAALCGGRKPEKVREELREEEEELRREHAEAVRMFGKDFVDKLK